MLLALDNTLGILGQVRETWEEYVAAQLACFSYSAPLRIVKIEFVLHVSYNHFTWR